LVCAGVSVVRNRICRGADEHADRVAQCLVVDRLSKYPFYFAALGEFEFRDGRLEKASEHFQTAHSLARNTMERHFFDQRIAACKSCK